jgi:tryptophan synthase beta chain
MLHQTIIGLEAKEQLKKAGEKLPDVVIGCAGGGSNFAGLAFPFTYDKIHGAKIKIVPVEPAACPKMTKGNFVYDHGDVAGMTPLLPMHSLGHTFVPKPIHAGGLRYHGMAPLVCQGIVEGLFEPKAYGQLKCYESAMLWAKTEGMICAPETSHAIAATIDEAIACRESGEKKVILFNYSGHGLMDLAGYDAYLGGRLTDYTMPESEILENLAKLAGMPKAEARKTGKW